jgi:hypothetical protein
VAKQMNAASNIAVFACANAPPKKGGAQVCGRRLS